MTTFLEIANSLVDRIDGDRFSTIYSVNLSSLSQTQRRYREHINLAYHTVAMHLGYKNEYRETQDSITLLANTEAYDIPAAMRGVYQVKVDTDPPLPIIPWPDFEQYKSETVLITTTGTPNVCAIYQRKIYFYPLPEQGYTVTLYGSEGFTELNLDNDEPDLAPEFIPALKQFALYYEMDYEGNPRAGALLTSENGGLQAQGGQAAVALHALNLAKREAKRHFTQPPRMRSYLEIAEQDTYRRIIRG